MAAEAPAATSLLISAEALERLSPQEYYGRYLESGLRPDGRSLGEARQATLATSVVRTAIGSASVRLGRTCVIAGVTCEALVVAGKGSDDSGEVHVHFEAPGLSGMRLRAPTAADGVEGWLQQILARARVLAPHALRITPEAAAWALHVDVYCLEHDGNILDAALLAALAALKDTRLPPARYDESNARVLVGAAATDGQPVDPMAGARLELIACPLPLTLVRALRCTLADPSADEEAFAEARITVVVDSVTSEVAVHKPGGAPLTDDELRACINASRARADVLAKLMQDALRAAATAAPEGDAVAVPASSAAKNKRRRDSGNAGGPTPT